MSRNPKHTIHESTKSQEATRTDADLRRSQWFPFEPAGDFLCKAHSDTTVVGDRESQIASLTTGMSACDCQAGA